MAPAGEQTAGGIADAAAAQTLNPKPAADGTAAHDDGPQRTSGSVIRAFVDSLPPDDAGASAQDETTAAAAAAGQPQRQAAAAQQRAEEEAEEAAAERTDFLAGGPNYLDLSGLSADFAPLSGRDGAKKGKKRRRGEPPQQGQGNGGGRQQGQGGGAGGDDALAATYRRIGLDGEVHSCTPFACVHSASSGRLCILAHRS